LFIGAAAAAFAAGWAVNGWRLEAQQTKALEQLTEELGQRLKDQATKHRLANDRLRLRETDLLQELDEERRSVEILTEEIGNAPVVTLTERVEVPANCPAVEQCATVDSLRYRALYNRAATGTLSDPGAGLSALRDPADTP
jgi:hypothetical protein